jgi:hypothetical protein
MVTGVALLTLGIAGFFVTGSHDVVAHDHDSTLLGFGVNPLHNLVHLITGLLGVVLWRSLPGSRAFGLLGAAVYGAAFVFGVFALDETWNILALNTNANRLHLVLAAVGVTITGLASRELRRAR